MSTPNWTDESSRLIAMAAPEVAEATPAELDRVWARVRAEMQNLVPTRRRRGRALVVGGIAAATMTLGGVAAAGVFSAHTGKYPVDAEDVRLGGPGERLDPAAPDYGAVITELTSDIPFPSDEARAVARDNEVRDGQRDEPGSASVATGALRFWTARAAVCSWANEWSAAMSRGDQAAEKVAAQHLREAPSWPAVTDLDPQQTIKRVWVESVDAETGEDASSWVLDNTPAGYFPLVRTAAISSNRGEMASVLAHWGACSPALMTDFPQALAKDLR